MLSGNPLLFENAVELCAQQHGEWRLDVQRTYHHCKTTAFLPITTAEVPLAALEYPIVLIEDGEYLVPVAILGAEAGVNPRVSASGEWLGRYIPAYARQYPFILAPYRDRNGYVVCIDSDYRGFSTVRGLPLFEDGKRTRITEDAVRFASEYQLHREKTDEFTRAVRQFDLVETREVIVPQGGNGYRKMDGFLALKRGWGAKLPASVIEQWIGNSYLRTACLLDASLANVDRLVTSADGA